MMCSLLYSLLVFMLVLLLPLPMAGLFYWRNDDGFGVSNTCEFYFLLGAAGHSI